MSKVKVAVVILNWNGKDLLEQFLPSVVQYSCSPDVEIVVADNCSTDDSVSFIEQNYPHITCLLLPENLGYAEGYNRALSQIDAEYFVLLNSDVEVTPNWLAPIIDFLDANLDIAAAQPKILSQRNKAYFEYAGAAGGFIDKYGYPFCRGRIFGQVEKDSEQYNDIIDIFWASGASLFIRAKDFFKVGGLDASFFAHMEEIDLCWRLNSRGRRVVCIPSSTVYHVGGATLNEESPRKTFLNFRNNLLMLYKNLPENSLNKVLCIRMWLDYLAAIQFFITGKRANAKEILRAHKEFRKLKSSYTTLRSENTVNTIVADINTIYKRSILVGFYLRGRKVFSKLREIIGISPN